jgi:hypothetical protein
MSLKSLSLKGAAIPGLGLLLLLAAIAFQGNLMADGVTTYAIPSAPPLATNTEIALAGSQDAAVRSPSAPEAWGGARSGSEATLSDRVVSYEIEAKLDPVKHIVDGKQRLTWRNRSKREIHSVYLHLYLNAFEGSGSTFFTEKRLNQLSFRSEVDAGDGEWGHIELRKVQQNGKAVTWQFIHPDGGPTTDHTVVKLDLPQPVPAGGSTTLDIDFQDQLPRVIARTGYFGSFHLVGQWFPKIAVLELPGERGLKTERWNAHEMHLHSEFYADYGLYDVKISVPKGYTVGATGAEQGPPLEKDGMLTHHFIQGDVHDFAWTADNRTAKALQGETRDEPGVPKVNIKVLFPPEFASNAAPVLKATQDAIAYFSKTLGPYPYKTVTAVIPPMNADEAGGMEYPTFFTTDSVRDLTPGASGEYDLDFVTIHEFGHDYFYGILGSNEFEEPMLDEGLNQYWDQRMLVNRKQKIGLGSGFTQSIGLGIQADNFEMHRLFAELHDPADGLGQNSWLRLSSRSYGSVYSRTTVMMHDLEQQLTKPVLERAFKQYYANWKFRHPSIADLRETLAQSSGQRALVERFFEQHVYAANKVDDRVEKIVSEEEKAQPGTRQVGARWQEDTEDSVDKQNDTIEKSWEKAHPDAKREVKGPFPWRTTVILRRSGVAVPQTVIVKFADGSQEKVVWNNNERWQRYTWLKPAKGVSAEIDPERVHHLDANKLNDSRTLKADHSASRRWGSELAAVAQTLFALMVNL